MVRTLWSGGLVVFLAACSPSGNDDRLDDPLILELGGNNLHIAPELRKRVVLPEPAPEPGPAVDPAVDPAVTPEPELPPVPGPTPRQQYREIALPEGGSLYKLCEDHLGDGSRWKVVAEANGWSENQVRRLPAGTMVRIPLR